MRLVYYKKSTPNFGDDLNGDLWPSLVPDYFNAAAETGFVGIGTIIGMPVTGIQRLHVFSSGAGYDRPEAWRDLEVTYECVRGPVSARLLGLADRIALTDGAILTPLAEGFPQRAAAGSTTLVIPHFQSLAHPGWAEAVHLAGYELLDPRGAPKEVIRRIAGARLVLTESLHGAILADTYGVPWVAFATSGNFGATKWVDWCLSLGMQCRFTMVPPPDASLLLAFGRGPWAMGTRVEPEAGSALSQFEVRMAPSRPSRLKAGLKAVLAAAPALRRVLLGFHPARTAQALTDLAAGPVEGSSEVRRNLLRDEMLERLRKVTSRSA